MNSSSKLTSILGRASTSMDKHRGTTFQKTAWKEAFQATCDVDFIQRYFSLFIFIRYLQLSSFLKTFEMNYSCQVEFCFNFFEQLDDNFRNKSLWVSRVLKYPKKCLEDLTMFFMSTWWGDSKNMKEIEFSRWLFELSAK